MKRYLILSILSAIAILFVFSYIILSQTAEEEKEMDTKGRRLIKAPEL